MWGSGTLDIYYLLLLQRYNKYKKKFLIKLKKFINIIQERMLT